MAILPRQPCRRCRVAHSNRNGFCDVHQEYAVGWFKKQKGKTTTERGYGHDWRLTRERILKRDKYCCVPCSTNGMIVPATDVDHIVNKENGGTDADDNLQSICKDCHREKTLREAKAAREKTQAGRGIDKV